MIFWYQKISIKVLFGVPYYTTHEYGLWHPYYVPRHLKFHVLFFFTRQGLRWMTSRHGYASLHWRHNGRDGVSNNHPHHCLLKRLFRRRSKKTSKLRVTGLCEGNSPVTGDFPAQMASNAENVSIWWRHHVSAIQALCERSHQWFPSQRPILGKIDVFCCCFSC